MISDVKPVKLNEFLGFVIVGFIKANKRTLNTLRRNLVLAVRKLLESEINISLKQ